MTRSPRVTIGLPVFNGERYLAEAIESILGQDFEDFELIISDNASTDATEEITRKYAATDSRVDYRRNATNIGAAPNYNLLVEVARGEYFKWAAHDDVCAPGFVGRCVEVLDADPDVSLVFPRAAEIDDTSRVVDEFPSLAYATEARAAARARAALRTLSPCFESFGLMRTPTLLGTAMIGPYTGSDRTLFLQLALRGRFREIDEVLFLHRQHENRSVHKYADDRARNAWFDPARAGRRTSPRWRLLYEYSRSIWTAPIPWSERVRACSGFPSWIVRNRRTLGREAVSLVRRPHQNVDASDARESEGV